MIKPLKRNTIKTNVIRNEFAVEINIWQRSGQRESSGSLWWSGHIESWGPTKTFLLKKQKRRIPCKHNVNNHKAQLLLSSRPGKEVRDGMRGKKHSVCSFTTRHLPSSVEPYLSSHPNFPHGSFLCAKITHSFLKPSTCSCKNVQKRLHV